MNEIVEIKRIFSDKWEDLEIGGVPIVELSIGIDIVRASGFRMIQLRQGNREWDNL